MITSLLTFALLTSASAFAQTNPFDADISEAQLSLDRIADCAGMGPAMVCPVLMAGTLTKVLLEDKSAGQTFLVWKTYWVNHRPILYAFTAALVFKPYDAAKKTRVRVVFKGTGRQDGSSDLKENPPTVIAIAVQKRKVTVGQTFLKADGTHVRVDQNAPLFAFDLN